MIKLIKQNLFSFYKIGIQERSRYEYEMLDYSYAGEKWPTRVWIKNTEIYDEKELERFFSDDFFKEKNISWFLENCSTGKYIRDFVIKKGYTFLYESAGMIKDNEDFIFLPDNLLSIEKVATEQKLEIFKRIVSKELFEKDPREVSESIFINLFKNENVELYLLSDNDKHIGTGGIFLDSSNSGGIYMISIDKAFRRQGYGKYITSMCINRIKHLGYRHSVLNATLSGEVVYRELGFVSPVSFYIIRKK